MAAKYVSVTSDDAELRMSASDKAKAVESVPKGKSRQVIDSKNGWYAVTLDEPVGGMSSGWISAEDIILQQAAMGFVEDKNALKVGGWEAGISK